MIKAIVFDCFGVLITDVLQGIKAGLARTNPAAAQEIRDLIAANNRGFISPPESTARIAAIMGQTLEQFRGMVAEREQKNTELLGYIAELRKDYKTALLSNVARSSLDKRFPDNELQIYFDLIAASAEIGAAKPDRDAYHFVSDQLGLLPEECVFTDDKLSFCQAAESAGMHAIVYEDFTQFKSELETLLL